MSQRFSNKIFSPLIVIALTFGLLQAAPVFAHPEVGQSINIAYIDSLQVINGGTFPTATTGPGGSFVDFNFYMLPVGSVGSSALGPNGICGPQGCDTVLLNVASFGMGCSVNSLGLEQKEDLVNFVAGGYKLIIYDSECPPQDYSWLPFSFTTSNPGAMGAQGTLTIVEENTLSSNDPNNPHFIDAQLLSTQTDAVGDMNVMTTFDPNWFVDMAGTNILGDTGPVHTYAKFPSGADFGLFIYNGLDVDFMDSGTAADSSNPAGNLAKIWLHELEQPFNPSRLPGGVPVVGIALTPASATLSVGLSHTVTATITDLLGVGQQGKLVSFNFGSGPNMNASGTCSTNTDCTTDADGHVSFTYLGSGGVGTDELRACFTNDLSQQICSSFVTVEWQVIQQSEIDYFALGDSIASGHGLMDNGGICRRSDRAYPYKVAEKLETRYAKVNTYFLACSGATAHRSSGQPLKTLRSQVDVALSILSNTNPDMSRPVLISITIGMNDAGWSEPAQMGVLLHLPDNKFITQVLTTSAQIKEDVQKQIDRFADYPNVSFVITTYPNPVNKESVIFSLLPEVLSRRCSINLTDKYPCYIRTEIGIHAINEALTQLEQPGKVEVTKSLHDDFHDHASPHQAESPNNSCGNAPPEAGESWIQYPGEDNINSNLPTDIRKRLGITEEFGDCFHPNDAGAQKYAEAVDEAAKALGR